MRSKIMYNVVYIMESVRVLQIHQSSTFYQKPIEVYILHGVRSNANNSRSYVLIQPDIWNAKGCVVALLLYLQFRSVVVKESQKVN